MINALSIILPIVFSFYPKAPFYKKWRYVWIALLLPGVIFLAWDEAFTRMGVWGFNPKYLTGIYLLSLPLEEVLFFICIPYACLFTYFALQHLIERDYLFPHQELISSALSVVLMVAGIFYLDTWYTGVTFLGTGTFLAFQMIVLRPRYMGRFYVAFAVILIPFFIVNGVLTGSFIDEQVVWYNNNENLGIRLGTIPVEDIFYALLLLVMNVSVYEWFRLRKEGYY